MADDTQFRDAVGKVMTDLTGSTRSELKIPTLVDFANKIIDQQTTNRISTAPIDQPLIQTSSTVLPAKGFVETGQGGGGANAPTAIGDLELIAVMNGTAYYARFNAVLGDPV